MLKATCSHPQVQIEDSAIAAEVLLYKAALERSMERERDKWHQKKAKGQDENTGHSTEQ